MIIREHNADEKEKCNQIVSHPLQSWQWGEFKEKNGAQVVRLGQFTGSQLKNGLQLMIHSLPKTDWKVGYLPKCNLFDQQLLQTLKVLAQKQKLIFIKIEPNSTTGKDFFLQNQCLYGRPLFTKYTFQLDLNQKEDELLRKMKQKTRYNIKLAQKKGVKISQDNSLEAFNQYLKLTFETTKRQKFYAHDQNYHQLMWKIMAPAGLAHLLKAEYQGKILVTWVVFVFNQVLYYPYGASSREHKEVQASSLMMWEAIRFGQKIKCHTFDMWGSLGPDPNLRDPWIGFHRFKQGFDPKLVEFVGTFDLIINPKMYRLYQVLDKWRWRYLKIKTFFS